MVAMILNQENPRTNLDSIGKIASGLCAVHCALCALAPSLFTLLGLEVLMHHEAEWTLTICAIIFAVGAAVVGWLEHKNLMITSSFGLGIIFLFMSRFLEESGGHTTGVVIGVVAGLILFLTHLKNSKSIRQCRLVCCD